MNWIQNILARHEIDFKNEEQLRAIGQEIVQYMCSNPDFDNSEEVVKDFKQFVLSNVEFLTALFWAYESHAVNNLGKGPRWSKIIYFYQVSFGKELIELNSIRANEQKRIHKEKMRERNQPSERNRLLKEQRKIEARKKRCPNCDCEID